MSALNSLPAAVDFVEPALETRCLTRVLAGQVPVTLIENVTLTIRAGEFVAITGPSGSGKSSLLYLLGLLDMPSAGEIIIRGRSTGSMSEAERAHLRLEMMGFVFQYHFLLPEFSILDNAIMPMRRRGHLSPRQSRDRAAALLDSFGLSAHIHKRPEQLSGGQRQRAAIARALANNPPIVLADEPTGSLDSQASAQVQAIFRSLVRDQGRTVVAVTHNVDFAQNTDRQIRIFDGRIAGQ
jgi:lipoprotein-releasing system ATP-binding protein